MHPLLDDRQCLAWQHMQSHVGSPEESAGESRNTHGMPPFKHPLHVRCGDDILESLRVAGLPGTMLKWCDVLCSGPTPAGLSADAWYATRAQFLASAFDLPLEGVETDLRQQDAALAGDADHDAIVLWFEHDLFDQSILWFLLDWFARHGHRAPLYLVTTDRFPGHPRFIGLGELNPEELLTLYKTVRPVRPEEITLAQTLWNAWLAPTPTTLEVSLSTDLSALPFAHGAIVRHLEDLPWTEDGLSRTERAALTAIDRGAVDAGAAFLAVQAAEERPWMGDGMLFAELDRLARLPRPFVQVSGSRTIEHETAVALTDTSRAILCGDLDATDANPIDRWIGGAHLTPASVWRWDAQRRRVIPPQ
jgi:hypothetical protein